MWSIEDWAWGNAKDSEPAAERLLQPLQPVHTGGAGERENEQMNKCVDSE